MRIKVPKYFLDFRCIASKCLDSCCVGWEIVIDEESRSKYSALSCDIGEEIRAKTAHGCFSLDSKGRCAFLDGDGMCRIIRELGEGYLCDICREHPRYFGISADGVEGGLGLGCEEAARLILKSGGSPDFVYTEHDAKYFSEDGHARISDRIRDMIYGAISRLDPTRLISYCRELAGVGDELAFEIGAGLAGDTIPHLTEAADRTEAISAELGEFFLTLGECEALDDDWAQIIAKARGVSLPSVITDAVRLKSLIFYFTHRYVRECVEDLTLGYKILFALYSSLAVIALSQVTDTDEPDVRAAVKFSKNIEYSTENVSLITDRLSDFCEL